MCHLASSLDSLPKMLGFSGDWKKGFFPHKFNIPDNQAYFGPLPDRSYYEPEEMKEKLKLDLKTFIGFVQCDIEPTKYLHHPIIGWNLLSNSI